jgi:hypothetical protein
MQAYRRTSSITRIGACPSKRFCVPARSRDAREAFAPRKRAAEKTAIARAGDSTIASCKSLRPASPQSALLFGSSRCCARNTAKSTPQLRTRKSAAKSKASRKRPRGRPANVAAGCRTTWKQVDAERPGQTVAVPIELTNACAQAYEDLLRRVLCVLFVREAAPREVRDEQQPGGRGCSSTSQRFCSESARRRGFRVHPVGWLMRGFLGSAQGVELVRFPYSPPARGAHGGAGHARAEVESEIASAPVLRPRQRV